MINLNRFDLISLRLFVAVVDGGSLTAGADRFGVSLPAASKRITELEQHCGMALLQRGQRGVTATPEGQTLHRHAIEVIARLEQLVQAVDDLQSGATGHLRLCANPSAFGGFLPSVLAEYARRYPHVVIDMEDALSEDGIRAVLKGTAELAVIGDNVPHEGLETIVCNVDQLVLLVPAGHALAGQQNASIVNVLEHDLVTLARSASLTRKVMAAADAVKRTPRIRVQVRSFDSMCRMVSFGLGVAILPRAAAALYAQALGLVQVDLEGIEMERVLLLAMRSRVELSAPAAALVEMIEESTAAFSGARHSPKPAG
ncbi:LysR family transcriptional regulator [Variovorax sp. CCNWLW235]|uniref:LysR family transcriptional regulator n=1 Tax=Variovorax sp. CCNWLW235 TaxID=3127463 RepID=UPI0030786258